MSDLRFCDFCVARGYCSKQAWCDNCADYVQDPSAVENALAETTHAKTGT